MNTTINLILWILACIGALFSYSLHFIDSLLTPKWFTMIGGILILVIYNIIYFLFNHGKSCENRCFIVGVIVSIVFSLAMYGILQYVGILPAIARFRVTGSFDNPAGFAASLCAGFPFFWLAFLKSKGGLRWIIAIASMIVISAIILSGSRAGVLSLVAVLLCLSVCHLKHFSSRRKWILFPVLLVGIIVGLYYMKKDSADGRLFIWKCSLPLIVENWLTGNGTGGFEAHYMDFQAGYFKANPSSRYSGLADNVQYPFNEYIRIAIDYGIIGLLVLVGWIAYLIYCYFKYPTEDGETAILCWFSVGTFAAFSYPLMYPFVWLMLLLSTWQLIKKPIFNALGRLHYIWLKVGSVLCLILLFYIGFQSYLRVNAEMKWACIANLPLSGPANRALVIYQGLQEMLGKDRYFLYNYSAGLYDAGFYREGLMIAEKCRSVWADYDVEILLGELHERLEEKKEAIAHYQLASYMCPSRFYPLYKQILLLQNMGEVERAKQLAANFINKPEKIPSMRIRQMKDVLKYNFLE